MQFLIAIPFFLTAYTQSLELETLEYYSQIYPPGTKLTLSREATQFCYVQQGKIVENILSKTEFQTDAIAFTKVENDTIIILNSKGQILKEEQNIILTLPKFESKDCKMLSNTQSVAIYCFDTQHLYVIQNLKNVTEYQLDKIKDIQIFEDKYIVLKGKELFFNFNEIIDSINTTSIEVFRIINNKNLVILASQNQTSVIYIYKFVLDQFVYNRKVILKRLYENPTSILMTENEDIYLATSYQLMKYDGSETIYEIRNIQNLYNLHKQDIIISISNFGVFEYEDDQIELYNLMANPMQIIDLIIGKNNNYVLSRQYLYQVTYSKFNPELICYPQVYHKSGIYELGIKENDEEEKVIDIQIQYPILTTRNEHWLWIGAGIFLVGVLALVYCIYGSYRLYKLRQMKYFNEQKGVYQKQL
ncbi:unnamed protein product [Paramecium primaurelia]|uniref:Transmembrane protein n=1 Tax=Paramecium primaurelia TaxID=5886 RepID=A0A8S1KNJ9_PARPR|nr:unnamed protein product [Paramecium primaurelia]